MLWWLQMKDYATRCRQVSVQAQSQSTWACSSSTCGWHLLLSWSSLLSSSSSTNSRYTTIVTCIHWHVHVYLPSSQSSKTHEHSIQRTPCWSEIQNHKDHFLAVTKFQLHKNPTDDRLCNDQNRSCSTEFYKKLSYRRETAPQLPTWRGLGPPAHSSSAPSGYTYAYGRIRNPQPTYVKRAVH